MKKCKDESCPLYGDSHYKAVEVPYEGSASAKIVMVGESPGEKEEKKGRPFYEYADSGKKIRELVTTAGLNYKSFMVMNSARCRIRKENLATKDVNKILVCCRRLLAAGIKSIKPKAILVLGDFALRQVLHKPGIKKARGRWEWSEEFNCWVLPTYHPAAVLRSMALEPQVVQDLRLLADFARAGFRHKKAEKTSYVVAESIRDILDQKNLRVGFDTECQGNDWNSPNFVLISYSLSAEEGTGRHVQFYVESSVEEADFVIKAERAPADSKKKVTVDVGVKRLPDFERKMVELRELLERQDIMKYVMTGFDLHFVRSGFLRAGMTPPNYRGIGMDVQLAANLLDEVIFNLPALEDLQMAFTTCTSTYNSDFGNKYNKADMLSVPIQELAPYAVSDASITRQVGLKIRGELLKPEHKRLARYFVKFTMPTQLKTLHTLEKNGAYIDMESLPKVKKQVEEQFLQAQNAALVLIPESCRDRHEKAGLSLTRDSLVNDVLFAEDGLGAMPVRKTKGGNAWSVDKECRMLIAEDEGTPEEAVEFIRHYDEFSELHTLWSRYLKGFEKGIKPDGRIHSSFSLARTRTGRVSSSSPNMQNNPKRSKSAVLIRRLIKAAPGYLLMAADQGQAELRWAAELSGDPEMLRVFLGGEDIHVNTAKALINKSWKSLSDEEKKTARRNSKAINFGLLYLMTPPGFVRYARKEYGIELSEAEAENWIMIFFQKYNQLPEYHKKTIEFARRYGYVESPLGRRRRFPDINSKIYRLRAEAERACVNHPIQSPSSDAVLLSCNEILDTKPDPEKFRPVLFIHDELVFEVHEDSAIEEYAKLLKWHMENPPLKRDFGYTMKVPLASGVKIGNNLAEMKEMSL